MSDVAATLAAWLSTSASNSPAGTTTVGAGVDDNLRELQGVVVRGLSHKGADIASAATTDLGAVEGLAHDVTGVTTITSFGTVRAGIWKIVKFEGALTLTHNATSLILPGAANITTADGDVGIFISEGSGNWRCLAYMKAASVAATLAGTETLTNKTLNLTSNTLVATSAQLAAAVTDETGSGALVFGTSPSLSSPTFVTPALGTPASGVLTNCTGLPQAGFKSTTGDVGVLNTAANATLPGGTYGFYPQVWTSAAAGMDARIAEVNIAVGTTPVTNIWMSVTGTTANARQRYIQASPPYNLGNGDVPLFMFALVDGLGKIKATYVAPEPPWAYNGPTDIRADYYRDGKGFQKPRLTAQQNLELLDPLKRDAVLATLASLADVEITHAIKNADMPLIPHPFISNNLLGLTVVMLDAIGPFGDQMTTLHGVGESIGALLHDGRLAIDNTPLSAITPKGVIACRAAWK